MARSSLFRALRRIVRRVQPRPPERIVAGPPRPTRRAFLQIVGAAATVPLIPACGDNANTGRRIAIVGGGIAGLTAAHFLAQAGIAADVYEAAMRTGGRMYTQRELAGGQLVELGGELIDTDHVVIQALAEEFGLGLDDLIGESEMKSLRQDTFYFDNAVLADTAIVTAFTPVAAKMQMALAAGDASGAEFDRIDAMSIPQWLETEAGLPASSQIRRLLEIAYLEEFGLEVAEQSAWNLLTLIDAGSPDPFRVFGDSDERFHIHQGNDALIAALAAELEDHIHLDHALTKVTRADQQFELTFASGGSTVVDHVIYALPFTKLREVDLDDAGLSEDKRTVIDELGYGTNAKLMLQFSDRHWETAHGSGGGVITDVGELQTMWATSRGQGGGQGILTNFVGGARGIAIGTGTAEAQADMVLPWIETVFPGSMVKYVGGSAIRQHWPSYEFTKGSYASYKVGQWAFFGTEGRREGNQHFCGEHCSEDFQGYMEGGAETGAMVAGEVLDDLGIAQPPALAAILDDTTARPRASYHAGFGARMRISQVRRR